jgi:hypothetical protein
VLHKIRRKLFRSERQALQRAVASAFMRLQGTMRLLLISFALQRRKDTQMLSST